MSLFTALTWSCTSAKAGYYSFIDTSWKRLSRTLLRHGDVDGTRPKRKLNPAAETHQPEQIQARLRRVNRSEGATFELWLQTQRGRAAESEQA